MPRYSWRSAPRVKSVDTNRRYAGIAGIFHDQVWSGEISLAGGEAKVEYKRAHVKQALEKCTRRGFEEVVANW